MMSPDKASNAIVATVGFYADALATAVADRNREHTLVETTSVQLARTMGLLARADELIGGLVSRVGIPDVDDKPLCDLVLQLAREWHDEFQKLTVGNGFKPSS